MRSKQAIRVMLIGVGLLQSPTTAISEVQGERQSRQVTPATKAADRAADGLLVCDPTTGTLWKVGRDFRHPGGPGKMVEVGIGARANGRQVLVRNGELLRVSRSSPLVQADLGATALTSGSYGDWIRVRIQVSGQVVRARIVSPGGAVLADTREALE
ncbi:flagella basal body P-ring formation protein FlgA [Occallatibacter savannae]|uniref:flagella basal body P-ring formation protein FlgA n=1 Tax=Occallatibacter savannae TaxID=1002691 RepID=UPI000D68A06A